MRVMIVEDQTMIRSLLESYFRAEDGYRITASIPGAKQAVEVCRTSSVDLILMDVQANGEPRERPDCRSSDQSHGLMANGLKSLLIRVVAMRH